MYKQQPSGAQSGQQLSGEKAAAQQPSAGTQNASVTAFSSSGTNAGQASDENSQAADAIPEKSAGTQASGSIHTANLSSGAENTNQSAGSTQEADPSSAEGNADTAAAEGHAAQELSDGMLKEQNQADAVLRKDEELPKTDAQKDALSENSLNEKELPEDEPEEEELFHMTKNVIPLTPGLSEEELTELLAPVKESSMTMPELSQEELAELLAPSGEELENFADDTSGYASSLMAEVSKEDDPELRELARQILEIQRQEQAEKMKKKNKKKKRKR